MSIMVKTRNEKHQFVSMTFSSRVIMPNNLTNFSPKCFI